jgi:hypothetical protein
MSLSFHSPLSPWTSPTCLQKVLDVFIGLEGENEATPVTLKAAGARDLDNNVLTPSAWHLPHGWHMSASGYIVAPIPLEGSLLDEYIEQRWKALPPA